MSTQTLHEANTCCRPGPTQQASSATYSPRVDIVETQDAVILYADLPGVAAEHLEIRYEDRELIIKGKVTARQSGASFLKQEYGVGDFYRAFSVGEQVDSGKIEAELKNGVLAVQLPKAEAVKPRRIAVRTN